MKGVPGSNCTVQYVPRVIATKYFIKTFLKDYSAPEIAKFLSIWGTMKAILYRSKVKKAIKRIREHVFNKLKQDKKWNSKNNKFPQDVNVTMFDPGRSSLYKKLFHRRIHNTSNIKFNSNTTRTKFENSTINRNSPVFKIREKIITITGKGIIAGNNSDPDCTRVPDWNKKIIELSPAIFQGDGGASLLFLLPPPPVPGCAQHARSKYRFCGGGLILGIN